MKLQLQEINFIKPYKSRKGLKAFLTGDSQGFQLYDTLILNKCYPLFWLNSGGFRTNHTKNCINDNLPKGYQVFQKNFDWFVDTPFGVVEFKDEMVINYKDNKVEVTL